MNEKENYIHLDSCDNKCIENNKSDKRYKYKCGDKIIVGDLSEKIK